MAVWYRGRAHGPRVKMVTPFDWSSWCVSLRVKVGYLGRWDPLASEGQKAAWGFLGTRGSLDPKASR